MIRTVQDPEGRLLAVDVDSGVNDVTTKQLGSILFESVLSVNRIFFELKFKCKREFCLVYTYGTRFWFKF